MGKMKSRPVSSPRSLAISLAFHAALIAVFAGTAVKWNRGEDTLPEPIGVMCIVGFQAEATASNESAPAESEKLPVFSLPEDKPVATAQPEIEVTPSSSISEATVEGPTYASNPYPEYPIFARKMGYEGRVVLAARVSAEGLPLRVVIKVSSGYDSLDRAALEAVRQWTFHPGRHNGVPIEAEVDIPFVFRLTDSPR